MRLLLPVIAHTRIKVTTDYQCPLRSALSSCLALQIKINCVSLQMNIFEGQAKVPENVTCFAV